MTTSLPPSTNFRENYFQHPELTKIIGEPNHTSLTTLLNELKANAQSVHSNLGGGAHGHLGLVLSTLDYASVAPMTPYVRPRFPGSFVLENNVTNMQAQMLRDQHAENLRQFQEVEAVHNALVQQVIQAVDPMYLKALRNPITHALNVPLNQILQHLIDVYGTLTPREFQAKRDELTNFRYDVSLPVDVVFMPIDDLADIARTAHQPMTDEQKIGLAYIIFQNTGRFKSDLKTWNRLQIADKTWPGMKKHFREALENIRATDDVTMEDSSFNQINMINEVLAGVKQIVTDQVNEILPTFLHSTQLAQQFSHQQANVMPQAHPQPTSPSVVSPSIAPSITQSSISTMSPNTTTVYVPQTINAATQPTINQPVQQPPSPAPSTFTPITQQPTNYQQPFVPATNTGFSNYSGRRNNRNNRNRRNNNNTNQNCNNAQNFTNMSYHPQFQVQSQMQQPRTFLNGNSNISRRNIRKYCWSHGACAHDGYACQRPKQGHVPWATVANRCGGCNDFCT